MTGSNNREVQQRWTGGFFSAKLVAGVSGSKRPSRVQEERRTRLPPQGALRRSGGLLKFLWDADHQTLESMFRPSSTESYGIYVKTI
jgi:hypothetical protein